MMGNRRSHVCPTCRDPEQSYWREFTYTGFIEHHADVHDEVPGKALIQSARKHYQDLHDA